MRGRAPCLIVVALAGLAAHAVGAQARPHHVRDLRVTPGVAAPNGAARTTFRAVTPEDQRRRTRTTYVMHTYQYSVSGPARRPADCIGSEVTSTPDDIGVARPRRRRFSFTFGATDVSVLCSGRYTVRVRYVETICVFDVPGDVPDCRDRRSIVVGRRTFRVGTHYLARCPHAGSDVQRFAENRQAIVYDPTGSDLFGCFKPSGHRRHLAYPINAPDGYVADVTLVGGRVAFGAWEGSACQRYGSCPPGFVPHVYVAVVDLRTGARREFAIAPDRLNGHSAPVVRRSLVLTANGSIAWIGCVDCSAGYEVHVADRSGGRVVDSGPAIGADSLRLSGSTVTWTNGGAVRSAALSE